MDMCKEKQISGEERGYSDHILLTFTLRKRIKAHQNEHVCTPVLMETCAGVQFSSSKQVRGRTTLLNENY